jgi:hypothetical protein
MPYLSLLFSVIILKDFLFDVEIGILHVIFMGARELR